MTSDIPFGQSGLRTISPGVGIPFSRLFGSEFAAFLSDVKLGLIIESHQMRVLYVNSHLCHLMGMAAPPEDLIGKSCNNFAEQSRPFLVDTEGFLSRIENSRRSRKRSEGELLAFSDGRTLEFDYHPVVLDDDYQGHLWLFRDVTERERRTRTNDEFLESVLELLPGIVYIFDIAEQKNVYVSHKVATALGYSPKEIEAMGSEALPLLLHPEDQARVTVHHALLRNDEKETAGIEYRIAHRDGSWRWFHSSDRIFRRDTRGRTRQIVGVAQDITARKALEAERDTALRAQREAERRLAEAQCVTQVGSWEYDVASDKTTWSSETFRIFDLDPFSSAPGYDALKGLFYKEDRIRLDEGVQNALKRRVPYALDLRIIKRDGVTTRWVHFTGRPITVSGDTGSVTRLVGIVQDIEERHQLDEQVRHADKMQALGQFAAEITHEINNPIAAISGLAQLLEHHPEPQVSEDGRTIREMADRAGHIVRSLRKFVQEGSAFPASSTHPFIDLNSTVKTAVNLLKRQRGLPVAQMEIHLADCLPLVAADAAQIEQIIVNLVSNARQSMTERPKSERHLHIHTGLSNEGQRRLFVRITDTGTGIPEDLLDRIFAPFFTTKPRSKGMGLGLSICRTIARSHNGDISVESTVAAGSVFTLFLPVPTSIYDLNTA